MYFGGTQVGRVLMNPVLPVSAAASSAGPATSGCAAAAQSNTANNVSVHNFVCFMLDRHFTRNGGAVQGGRIFPRPTLFSPTEVTATMKLHRAPVPPTEP